jgi:hypothetical protein
VGLPATLGAAEWGRLGTGAAGAAAALVGGAGSRRFWGRRLPPAAARAVAGVLMDDALGKPADGALGKPTQRHHWGCERDEREAAQQ